MWLHTVIGKLEDYEAVMYLAAELHSYLNIRAKYNPSLFNNRGIL